VRQKNSGQFLEGEELMKQRRVYAIDLKRTAVARLGAGEDLPKVAKDLGIKPARLYDWKARARVAGVDALRGPGRPRDSEVRARLLAQEWDEASATHRRIAELERKIGQQEADLDFFRQALRHVKARRPTSAGRGARRSTKSSGR
jgi:transposase